MDSEFDRRSVGIGFDDGDRRNARLCHQCREDRERDIDRVDDLAICELVSELTSAQQRVGVGNIRGHLGRIENKETLPEVSVG